MHKKLSIFVISITLTVLFSSTFLVSANEQDFNEAKAKIDAVKLTDPILPTTAGDQKGAIGYIISRLFDTNGKISNWFLSVLGTRSDTAVLRWSGGNDGQLVQGSIFDDGTNVGIGGAPNSYKLNVSGTLNATNLRGDGSQITGITSAGIADNTITEADIDDTYIARKAYGVGVYDVRTLPESGGATGYDVIPNDIDDRAISAIFSTGYPGGSWRSALTVKGWTGGYGAWQIAGPASTGGNVNDQFFIRSGVGTTWNSWNTLFHSGNDGAGSTLDADLLDGINSDAFLRSNTNDTYSGGKFTIERNTTNEIETASDTSQFQILQNNATGDAYATFHIATDYAANFGIDGEWNDFAVGGWSMGANKYRVLHEGNLTNVSIPGSSITVDTISEAQITDSFIARNSELLDGLDSTAYTQSHVFTQNDFNTIIGGSRVTSINASANTPFGNAWYTVYNNRHRGGAGDGNNFGSQIAIGMTNYTNRIAFRNQNNGTWSGWNELFKVGGSGDDIADNTIDSSEIENNSITNVDINSAAAISGSKILPNFGAQDVTAGAYYYNSDERLKYNITKAPGIETVMQLSGKKYTWRHNDEVSYGFIAQEVEEVLPELVGTDDKGMKSVQYGNITAILVEAIKDQQKQIDALKQEITTLKK